MSEYGEENVWLVVPSYATGSSWDGTRSYTWKIEFCSYYDGRHYAAYKTQEAAEAARDKMNAKNVPFKTGRFRM